MKHADLSAVPKNQTAELQQARDGLAVAVALLVRAVEQEDSWFVDVREFLDQPTESRDGGCHCDHASVWHTTNGCQYAGCPCAINKEPYKDAPTGGPCHTHVGNDEAGKGDSRDASTRGDAASSCGQRSASPEPAAGESPSIKLRPAVLWFAKRMEAQLRANDHKNGWLDDSFGALMDRLREEVNELTQAAGDTAVIREAADVANFAMMIADGCGPEIGATRTITPPKGPDGFKLAEPPAELEPVIGSRCIRASDENHICNCDCQGYERELAAERAEVRRLQAEYRLYLSPCTHATLMADASDPALRARIKELEAESAMCPAAPESRNRIKGLEEEVDAWIGEFRTAKAERDKALADNKRLRAALKLWNDAAKESCQPAEFYKDYNEATMRAMQALLTDANKDRDKAMADNERLRAALVVACDKYEAQYKTYTNRQAAEAAEPRFHDSMVAARAALDDASWKDTGDE